MSVRVDDWRQTARVSVDRVGVYFRDIGGRESGEPARVRLVFDVRLEGSARKLVTVRSALVLRNGLPDPIEVKMGASAEMRVEGGANVPVPLEHSHRRLHIRPALPLGYIFCQPEIDWRTSTTRAGETRHEPRKCFAPGGRKPPSYYYFSAEVRREYYPPDSLLPAHSVSLLPSLLVVNLLPHDLHYVVWQGTGAPVAEGVVHPGKEAAVSSVDPSYDGTEIRMHIEGFK